MSDFAPPAVDAERLRALAQRLDASPRELLALAVRLAASPDDPIGCARIGAELARIRAAQGPADHAVAMLLLGYAAFAADDIDRALGIVWHGADVGMT